MNKNIHAARLRVLLSILFVLFGLAVFFPLNAHAQGIITTVAGGGPVAPIATQADMPLAQGIALDSSGNIYIAVTWAAQVYRVDTSGNLTVVAGTGSQGYSGDGGPATSATFSSVDAVAVDSSGNLFICDLFRVRRVAASPDHTVTTVAGNGTLGYSGDGGPATSASLLLPTSVAVDPAGNLSSRILTTTSSAALTPVRKLLPPMPAMETLPAIPRVAPPAASAALLPAQPWGSPTESRWTMLATSISVTRSATSGAWTTQHRSSRWWPAMEPWVLAATAAPPRAPA